MVWSAKRFLLEVLVIVFGTTTTVAIFEFPQYSIQLNVWALIATLVVLIGYAYDTHRIADQTVEANLRPVILRSGYIKDWNDINFKLEKEKLQGNFLQFSVLKHIVKDVEGCIVLDGKKFTLLFGNEISKTNENNDAIFSSSWAGWMNVGTVLRAAFDPRNFDEVDQENSIRVTYRDIEGNQYFTSEDKDFHQTSGKL
ncbi:MAG: hypothetical protein ACYC4I_02345 [Minisyncoccota bacterium]